MHGLFLRDVHLFAKVAVYLCSLAWEHVVHPVGKQHGACCNIALNSADYVYKLVLLVCCLVVGERHGEVSLPLRELLSPSWHLFKFQLLRDLQPSASLCHRLLCNRENVTEPYYLSRFYSCDFTQFSNMATQILL